MSTLFDHDIFELQESALQICSKTKFTTDIYRECDRAVAKTCVIRLHSRVLHLFFTFVGIPMCLLFCGIF